MNATTSTPQALRCGVVGAGIAGLGAAIALTRAGHEVEVFEKSMFKNEIGAAISITPNGNLVLDRWGFDAKRAGETDKVQFRMLDVQTCELVAHVDYDGVAERYGGHRFNAFHRVDMHEELRRLAREAGVEIQLGHEVVDLDCSEGRMTFRDGTTSVKDLVVVADGIKSRFVPAVTGEDIKSTRTGRSVYRTLVPVDRLMTDPLTRPVYEGQASGFVSCVNKKAGIFLMTYPCRSDQLMNVAVFHTTKPHQVNNEDWNSPATVDDCLEVLDGFHPMWRQIIKNADRMNCYTVGQRDILPRFNRGKVVLIGDAAHPMQPTHAQGGSMGLEDAATLEVMFRNWMARDSVEHRLELFNQFRLPRDTVTALYSNAMFYYEQGEIEKKIREYWQGPLLPQHAIAWNQPIRDFFFGYDVFAEANKAMDYKDMPGGLPEGVIKHFW